MMRVVCAFFMAIWYSQSIGNLLCMASSFGDQFEVYNHTLVQDAVSMVPDLAIQGNILLRTNHGKLYTTNMKTAIQLTTPSELNINVIPSFVQTTPEDLIYAVSNTWTFPQCHCHLNRRSKVASALYVSDSLRCNKRCQKRIQRRKIREFITVKLDERYDDIAFSFDDQEHVAFFNVSQNYIHLYSNMTKDKWASSQEQFLAPLRNYKVNYPMNYIGPLKWIVQNGDFSYLLYGNSVYQMDMPSVRRNITELAMTWISGGTSSGYVDSDFARAQYSSLKDIVRINKTMLAVADYSNNRVRLLNLQTNTTSSLCGMPRYLGINSTITSNTCDLRKPYLLLFMNDNLYFAWEGGYGRIHHTNQSMADEQDNKKTYGDTMTSLSASAFIGLVLVTGTISMSIFMWRRKLSITRASLRRAPEPHEHRASVFELVNRSLPSISAAVEAEQNEGREGYGTPELEQEDLYAMIGDQYYHTIVLTTEASSSSVCDRSEGDFPSSNPNSSDYADSGPTAHNSIVAKYSDLDYFGYIKPTCSKSKVISQCSGRSSKQ